MRGKSRIETFNKAVAAAEARRRKAISEAYRAFNIKHSETKRLHRSTYMIAYAAWRAIKNTPDAEGYAAVRNAFLKASEVADHREARGELDRAIRVADEVYEAQLARAWGGGRSATTQ
jgi:hypothetical protein